MHFFLFHCQNGYVKAPKCYVILTLAVMLFLIETRYRKPGVVGYTAVVLGELLPTFFFFFRNMGKHLPEETAPYRRLPQTSEPQVQKHDMCMVSNK